MSKKKNINKFLNSASHPHLLGEITLRQGRLTAVIHHDDLSQEARWQGFVHCAHRVESVKTLAAKSSFVEAK